MVLVWVVVLVVACMVAGGGVGIVPYQCGVEEGRWWWWRRRWVCGCGGYLSYRINESARRR